MSVHRDQPRSSARRGAHPLTEDRLLFDGPRATYGRFRVVHQLGAGSVGPVFRGEDGETRRAVAIKVIRVGLTPERVELVASHLSALPQRLPEHPALVPLLDAGVVDGEPYLVSPLVDGDSLDVALRQYGPARLADALPRLRQLADGLDLAAAAGLAHGSLHPRDIIVSIEHTVITGTGIAPMLERAGVSPPVRRPYCAPEVARGHGIGHAADLYTLAAIAYEWLTGQRVPALEELRVVLPGLGPETAPPLTAVFVKALARDAESRYATATAFVDAVADAAPVLEPRSRSARRGPKPVEPRLAFDDEVAEPAPPAPTVDPGDVDLPLIVTADAGVADDAEADPLGPFLVSDTAPPNAVADQPSPPERPVPVGLRDVDLQTEASSRMKTQSAGSDAPPSGPWTWRQAVALAAVWVVLAAVGGWLLLRWGTPSAGLDAPVAAPAQDLAAPDDRSAGRASASPPPRTVPPAQPAAASPASDTARRAQAPSAGTAPAAPRVAAPPAARPSPPRVSAESAAAARRPQPAAAAPVRPAGRLLVRSTPSGGEVFVNGARRGVTPLALRDLAAGAYAIRVTRAGYSPAESTVVIDGRRPARTVDLTLGRVAGAESVAPAPAAATGILVVDSRPSGARVVVDGVAVGVTPVTLPAIGAGTHAVRIELSGYQPITATTAVEARARARVAVTLTPERPR